MKITESDIEKLATLAHLEVTDDEKRTLAPQLESILAYIEQLNELDTTEVTPSLGGLTAEGERTDASREDEIKGSIGADAALREAPDAVAGHFRVPKVL